MTQHNLICPQCGAKLSKDSGSPNVYICQHCGNKQIITSEQLSNNIFVNNNVTKNIYGNNDSNDEKYERYIKNAESWLKINEYKNAIKELKSATLLDVGNYVGWWLMTKAKLLYNESRYLSANFSAPYTLFSIEEDFQKAYNFASEEIKPIIKAEYEELKQKAFFQQNSHNSSKQTKAKNIDHQIGLLTLIMSILIIVYVSISIVALSTPQEIPAVAGGISFVFALFILCAFCIAIQKLRIGKHIIQYVIQKDEATIDEINNHLSTINKEQPRETLQEIIESLLDGDYLVGYNFDKNKLTRMN